MQTLMGVTEPEALGALAIADGIHWVNRLEKRRHCTEMVLLWH